DMNANPLAKLMQGGAKRAAEPKPLVPPPQDWYNPTAKDRLFSALSRLEEARTLADPTDLLKKREISAEDFLGRFKRHQVPSIYQADKSIWLKPTYRDVG